MVQQVDYATQLPQYDMMIRSVLKAGHVFRTSPDYDDYYQELRLIIPVSYTHLTLPTKRIV